MPFRKDFDEIYFDLIKPTVEHSGIKCERVDEFPDPSHITADIVNCIEDANIIIADLTTRNPNVFYELAIAHSLNKPTIMISQNIGDVPFDLQNYRVFTYERTIRGVNKFKEVLTDILNHFLNNEFRFSNPVLDNIKNSTFEYLLNLEKIVEVERNAEETVWVLAPDIEIGPRYFQEVMRNNMINKLVKYKYIIPDDEDVKNDYLELIESLNLGEMDAQIQCKIVSPHLIESDLTIIDQNSPREFAFILAPCESPYYHYRVIGNRQISTLT